MARGGAPSELFTWWPSCPCGAGLVDLAGVARELDAAGFQGALAVELDLLAPEFAARPEPELVARSLDHLRGIVAGATR